MATDAAQILLEAAKVWKEKNRVYGDNYHYFGRVMTGLYPHGATINDEEDWVRMGIILNLVTCLSRHCAAPKLSDVTLDLTVYSAMLREVCGHE